MSRKNTVKTKDIKMMFKIILLPFTLLFTLIVLIIKLIAKTINKKKVKQNVDINISDTKLEEEQYQKRELMTDCELEFYKRLQNIFKDKYIIQPQIPLRMIITKNTDILGIYANELHKYIDYGIFDKEYNILALIELNDKSHKTNERYERDIKVKNICEQANIPLITFWTYGIQTDEDIKCIINEKIEEQKNRA